MSATLTTLENKSAFIARHIGPSETQITEMCRLLNVGSVEELITQTVPAAIRIHEPLKLPAARSEHDTLDYLKKIASKNKLYKSFIGMGYYDTMVPNVILRNVLENPGWYTAYTPYQPEISQGRLETLLNYQQMVVDLTGMDIANASLLDEGTAAAEAMALARRSSKSKSNIFYIDADTHPQTTDLIKTRAEAYGFEVAVGAAHDALKHDYFGVLLSYPGSSGQVNDYSALIAALRDRKAVVVLATDLLSLCLLKTPGEMGADVAIGSAQRFGVPFGFGGPHAAFMACRDDYKRNMPGRIIGVSVDARGKRALRMAMQTREQHIRREKATSNICTAQVLLSNMAVLYAMYHGPEGLKRIAQRTHRLMSIFVAGLRAKGITVDTKAFFDTVTVDVGSTREQVYMRALSHKMNLRLVSESKLGISFDEKTTRDDVKTLWEVFLQDDAQGLSVEQLDALYSNTGDLEIPDQLIRSKPYLTHPAFSRYHSETDMLRYLKSLENKDFSLTHGMIPLGSCTMKLNATAEMIPVTWPEFGNMHPFVPLVQAQGYLDMIKELEHYLMAITGFDAISIQPNSGAQGEYAGLLAIRKFHESRNEGHRNVCLIPSSAHGTNPASAQMANFRVVVTACDKNGNVDIADLEEKAKEHADNLACLMMTYPSTHGVYEEGAKQICDLIHKYGGQVYMDGANLNAQVGLTMPARIGADVSHMNLHKTFCIPHGGGGPGMGPIGVRSHLAPFLPNHAVVHLEGPKAGNGAVSAAPWGSASILPISWAYITMMGPQGLKQATEVAILNGNYIAKRLGEHFPVLYSGSNGRVAHECILDIRPLKEASGITEEDIAKRLMDYGFHAPTMSFPVAGTLMVEPTESESKVELDRFCDAMIAIRKEIDNVQNGVWPKDNNPLVHAPHTLIDLSGEWTRPYSRDVAVFPGGDEQRANKFWPAVNRIDNVYGDRNLMCICPPTDSYAG